VSCYGWSIYWTFVMCLKKLGEFSFPSILIQFTCVISNSSNKWLKSGTSFWLALYMHSVSLKSILTLHITQLKERYATKCQCPLLHGNE
jgi:hypothetical protein